MTIFKGRLMKAGFSALMMMALLALGACTKSATDKGAASNQPNNSANWVVAKPDASGKLKCPNGDDAIKVTGSCAGEWHYEKKTGAKGEASHVCRFVFGPSVTCKKLGYADNGREACYGGAFVTDADAKVTNDGECKGKYNTVWNVNYQFDCCK